MNTLLILGPLGAILVGLLSIGIWRLKRQVEIRYFAFGGLTWFAVFFSKLIVDSVVTPELDVWATTTYGSIGTLITLGIYAGLRTGALQGSFTYLMFSRSDLRKMSLDEATAFGIGFGAFEAVFLVISSLVQFMSFIVNPSLLNGLTPTQRQAIEAQLNLPTWIIPATIIERVFTLFVHTFAALLVFISVTRRKLVFFFGAFFYLSLLDALVPYFQGTINLNEPVSIYAAEVWVVILGVIALAGTYLARKNLRMHQQQKLSKTKKV